MILLLLCSATLRAHRAEPISTEFALPFEPKAGNLKLAYEYEREGGGASEQTVPELELEFGIAPRWQINLGYPVFRIREGREESPTVVGGRFEVGTRYLLFGGATRNYAISLQGTVEAPTGNRRVVGDAFELGAAVFMDRYVGERVRLHSNLGWKTTAGGTLDPERALEYSSALVWLASTRWTPVVELIGRTNTNSRPSELAIQPELIFSPGPMWS